MNKRLLVIGGNGFLGCSLVPRLAALPGVDVVVFDLVPKAQNAAVYRSAAAVEVGDLTDTARMDQVIERYRPTTIYHLACATVPASGMEGVHTDVSVNLAGTIVLLEAVRRYGVPEIVFLSSGGTVYGVVDRVPVAEDAPLRPISSYGIMKACSEWYLQLYQRLYGFHALILRPSNFYGEFHTSRRQGLINVALREIAAGHPVTVFGDGRVVRDYVYVGDAAEIIVSLQRTGVRDGVFNLASGVGYTVNEVLAIIRDVTGPFEVQHLPARPCDVPRLVLDVTRLSTVARVPSTSLRDGIAATWRWIRGGREDR